MTRHLEDSTPLRGESTRRGSWDRFLLTNLKIGKAANWRDDILSALRDFTIVSELAGSKVSLDGDAEFLPAPHEPRELPAGKAAVYGFWCSGEWLKIGQIGPNSNPRYKYQHYNIGSAKSNLADTLKLDEEWVERVGRDGDAAAGHGITKTFIAAWIKQNTCRVNIFLPPDEKILRSLLEAFLHARLRPRYEGARSGA